MVTRLFHSYRYWLMLTLVVGVGFGVWISLGSAVGRCKAGYHFVNTPDSAPYLVTTCVKPTWKTVLYAFVPDASTEAQPLLSVTAPKQRATVTLDVMTIEADSLATALDAYFGGAIPTTLSYTSDAIYFQNRDIAIEQASETTTLNLLKRDRNHNTNINSETTAATALATTIYYFDSVNQALYILDISANHSNSSVAKKAIYTAQKVTATSN